MNQAKSRLATGKGTHKSELPFEEGERKVIKTHGAPYPRRGREALARKLWESRGIATLAEAALCQQDPSCFTSPCVFVCGQRY